MSDAARPDPDALLDRLQVQEAEARRGRLKIYFGACAGVGKTFAMLSGAQAARAQGTDVLVGVVETHGRAETQALQAGLPVLPPRALPHRERTLAEFDLDGALARQPQLVLVDELAHSNAPGSRHPKRWQDVQELLHAGIDVWTTMNVQHLESLNDVVGGITGVRVWETVPDKVFDEAHEVVIVDLPPDELLQRLKQGKVYLPQQAERALQHFFRKGNLIALRELALRRTADRVDGQMLAWRQGSTPAPVWGTRDSLLACVGPGEHAQKTVRSTARLAAQLGVPWHAVHVQTPALEARAEPQRQRATQTLKLAQDLGAVTATVPAADAAAALVKYARAHNLAKLVLGRGHARRWPWQHTLADRLGTLGGELDLVEVARPAAGLAPRPAAPGARPAAIRWPGYLWAAALCGATTLLATPLLQVLELANIVMLFLLAVVAVAVRLGRGPAVLAAFLSVGSFDFFFVAPRFSLNVSDVQYLVTFGVMLVVALVIGQLAAGLSFQARVAQGREDRMRALYEMSRDLSGVLMAEQVAEVATRFLASEFGARSALLVAGDDDQLQAPAASPLGTGLDLAIAQWSHQHAEPAGHGTGTLPASPVLYLPLKAPMRVRGVLALQPADPARVNLPEQRRLLETCASLLAISLERIHYVSVAQQTTLQMESERLRNSLLAAVSHDLRTPLAALQGLSESLLRTEPALSAPAADTAQTLHDAVLRMNALVANLLDMARLQAGAVRLNRQWQPLEEVVGSALRASAGLLAGRRVQVLLPPDLPFVNIDATLMERVLVNLLENAAKYTPPATPVEIRAQLGEHHIELWVDDHGPGLPRGREEQVFGTFERGHKESATPGAGLGLALCRAIAQAHGGTVLGLRRESGGARLVVRLPREEPPPVAPLHEENAHG